MISALVLSVAFFVLNSLNSNLHNEVEAKTNERVQMRNGWFATVGKAQAEEYVNSNVNDGNLSGTLAKFPNIKRRKLRTKEKNTNYEKTEKSQEVVKKKKKKRRKKKKKSAIRRFVKTIITGKDSNMSESREIGRGKPVDIIVHIKMSE